MSQASASRNIRYVTKSGTYSAIVNCPTGDIYQYWGGIESAPQLSYPDLSASQPELHFIVSSSRAAEGETQPYAIEVYVNNTLALWYKGESNKQLSWNNLLDLIEPSFNPADSAEDRRWKVKVKGNFVGAGYTTSIAIKFVGEVQFSGIADSVTSTYIIKVAQDTGSDTYRVAIVDGDGSNFTITQKQQNVAVKAVVQEKGVVVADSSTGYIYEWFIAAATAGPNPSVGWQQVGTSADTLSLSEEDIQTSAEVMVKAYKKANGAKGSLVGLDFQTVTDVTDPWTINPRPAPADETIEDDNPDRSQVEYTPQLVSRDHGTLANPQPSFSFILTDPVGLVLKNETKTPSDPFIVDIAAAHQANGDMNLVIIAND